MDSLFFVKTRISNECEIKAEITYENVSAVVENAERSLRLI